MADTVRRRAAWLRGLLALLLLTLFVAGALARARVRPLWHDEIFTWAVAQQPDATAIWRALRAGVDLNPPLYYLLVQQAAHLTSSGPLAVRLPAVAGFAVMLVALAAFVRTRCGLLAGGAAAAVVALSGAAPYAYEGRPYGVVLAAAAVALFAWQRVHLNEPSRARHLAWCAVLASALAAGFSSHYYAGLLVVPIACGEAMRTRTEKTLSPAVWAALLLPLAVFWFWRPLIAVAQGWSAGFWSGPRADAVFTVYQLLLGPLGAPLMGCLMLLALVAALTRSGWLPPARTPRGRPGVPGYELVALTAFALLPLLGLLAALFVTGAWHERYVLAAVVGVAGLCLAGLHASGTLALRTAATVLLVALAVQSLLRLRDWRESPHVPSALAVMTTPDVPDIPVLASDGLTFVELLHYAPPALVARLVYGLKPPSVIARTGTDSENRALTQLATLTPSLRLERFEPFVSRRRPFLVIGRRSWVTDELRARDLPLQWLAGQGDLQLFLVP